MSIQDYAVDHDKFEPAEIGSLGLSFPCRVCKHQFKSDMDEPCSRCGHNLNNSLDIDEN